MSRVLFVCRENAGRSQMAQAFFEQLSQGRHQARSAGTRPAGHVRPLVAAAMREAGLDVDERTPTRLTDELAGWADLVVTMGCGDECPVIPGRRYLDWDLPDPKDQPLPEVRRIRDDVKSRVAALIDELDRPTRPSG